jgi:hypothetical protein
LTFRLHSLATRGYRILGSTGIAMRFGAGIGVGTGTLVCQLLRTLFCTGTIFSGDGCFGFGFDTRNRLPDRLQVYPRATWQFIDLLKARPGVVVMRIGFLNKRIVTHRLVHFHAVLPLEIQFRKKRNRNFLTCIIKCSKNEETGKRSGKPRQFAVTSDLEV